MQAECFSYFELSLFAHANCRKDRNNKGCVWQDQSLPIPAAKLLAQKRKNASAHCAHCIAFPDLHVILTGLHHPLKAVGFCHLPEYDKHMTNSLGCRDNRRRPCSVSPSSRRPHPTRRTLATGHRQSWQKDKCRARLWGCFIASPAEHSQRNRGRITSHTMPKTSSPQEQPKAQETTHSTVSTTPMADWGTESRKRCSELEARKTAHLLGAWPFNMSSKQLPTHGIMFRPDAGSEHVSDLQLLPSSKPRMEVFMIHVYMRRTMPGPMRHVGTAREDRRERDAKNYVGKSHHEFWDISDGPRQQRVTRWRTKNLQY